MDELQERGVPGLSDSGLAQEEVTALGLSTVSYISASAPGALPRQEDLSVRYWQGGSSVTAKGNKGGPSEPVERKKRGKIVRFTRASRKRLQCLIGELDQDVAGLPLFVTLTYPGSWGKREDRSERDLDPKQWKRDLDVWKRRLERAYPGVWGIWRLEAQKRGAPHYHLLLWGVSHIPIDWIAQTWWEVVGSGEKSHLKSGTQVQRTRSWRGVHSYVGKYMAKVVADLPEGHEELWEGVGRYWGQVNPKAFPRAYKEVSLTPSQFTQILRILRRARYGPRSKRRHHPAIKALRACGPQAVANPDVCPQFIYERSLPRVRGLHLFMSEESIERLVAWVRD